MLNFSFNKEILPLSLAHYEDAQFKFNVNARKILGIKWRESVINDIQDRLRDVYRFYQTEISQYTNTELSRLLKLVDFQFNSYLREVIVKNSCMEYTNFLRGFTLPKDNHNIWKINDFPLL